MSHADHAFFVVLALVVAVLGSWTALDLFRRVRSHIGQARRVWLGAAAVAMGLSIWSMHFIAMLGFDPGSPVSYDPPLTALSLALAIGATAGALFSASRERPSKRALLLAGLAMGEGICLMHYVGMAALRSAVSLGYRPAYVAASLVIAVTASTAALVAAGRERSGAWRLAASVILGLAIVGMHYTAMAGLTLTPTAAAADVLPGAPPHVLGISVAAGTMVILIIALLASFYDQRLNVLTALEAGGVGYWELSLPDRRLQASPRAKAILGLDPEASLTYDDYLALLDREDTATRQRLLDGVLSEGADYDAEYRIRRPGTEDRWVNIRGRKVSQSRHGATRITGVMLDVTDRRKAFAALAEADRRHQLMIAELNHRVKNTLATVQSIAGQTAKRAESVEAFREAFEARLIALSNTHNALTKGDWSGARLHDIVGQELSPYAAEQYEVQGDEITLAPARALALGMMIHELTTNAVKHGALSRPTGCVRLRWGVEEGRLTVRWEESGGPPARPPERRGFGSRLIQATVAQLDGEATFDYPETGFTCRLSMLLDPEGAAEARAA